MRQLQTLKLIHWIFAVLVELAALVFFALWCIGGILLIRDGERAGWAFLVGGILVAAWLTFVAVLHVKAAVAAPRGRRRILQTGLALVHLANFPLGTAFAVFTLWLCWFNPETKVYFDTHDSRL